MNRPAFSRNTFYVNIKPENAFDFSTCPWSVKDAFFVYVYSIALFLVFSFWMAVVYSLIRFLMPQQFIIHTIDQFKPLKHFYVIFVFYVSLFLSIRFRILKKYHIDSLKFFIRQDKVLSDIVYGIKVYFKFMLIMAIGVIMVLLITTMWDMVFSSCAKEKLDIFLNAAQVEKRIVISHASGAFGTVILLILAPFFEEFYFRGCLYRALRARYTQGLAIIVSSFVFSLLHGYFFLFIYVFFIGIILAYIYDKRRSLIVPLTFHMLNNLAVILFFV